MNEPKRFLVSYSSRWSTIHQRLAADGFAGLESWDVWRLGSTQGPQVAPVNSLIYVMGFFKQPCGQSHKYFIEQPSNRAKGVSPRGLATHQMVSLINQRGQGSQCFHQSAVDPQLGGRPFKRNGRVAGRDTNQGRYATPDTIVVNVYKSSNHTKIIKDSCMYMHVVNQWI